MTPAARRKLRISRPVTGRLGVPPTLRITRIPLRVIRKPAVQQKLALPPRLLNLERDMLAADKHWRLAFNFVQRQGWRFENAIERDEQIAECFLKMCAALPKWKKERGALSTFLNQCFFTHLSSIAKRRGREIAAAELADDLPGHECEPEYSDEGLYDLSPEGRA